MEWLHGLFSRSPEIALFLSLAVGYAVGKVSFGKFQLGGVAGSLLVAVIVSQVGVTIDPGVKAILFALFIYAVGYESGPQFFNSLGRQSIREILLAVVMAAIALVTVVVMARLGHLDKGLAAGVAAGGLTQSAIIGTAGDAIARLNLPGADVARLQGNVAVGYAVTYVFGSFGAILVCVNLLPRFMGRGLREDAVRAESAMQQGVQMLPPGTQAAAPELVGRLYEVGPEAGMTVEGIERAHEVAGITIERVKRQGKIIPATPELPLQPGDIVLAVGRRQAMVDAAASLGRELPAEPGMDLVVEHRDIVVANRQFQGRTVGDVRANTTPMVRHGIYLVRLSRMGKPLPLDDATVVQLGDVVTLFGSTGDLQRVTTLAGYAVQGSTKTDFVYFGAGMVVGLLVGMLSVRMGSVPLTLGSGGGVLLSGLLFGWFRARHRTFGNLPDGAVQLLKDFGLAGFVVAVGLDSGLQAVATVRQQGLALFGIGVVVTVLPLVLTMLVGRYVLRYDNTAIFAGALSGSRSANPAFGEILDKAGNAIPTAPFAITYALANVLLTLLGPLIVALT